MSAEAEPPLSEHRSKTYRASVPSLALQLAYRTDVRNQLLSVAHSKMSINFNTYLVISFTYLR